MGSAGTLCIEVTDNQHSSSIPISYAFTSGLEGNFFSWLRIMSIAYW